MYTYEQIKGLLGWGPDRHFFSFFASDAFHSCPNLVRRQIEIFCNISVMPHSHWWRCSIFQILELHNISINSFRFSASPYWPHSTDDDFLINSLHQSPLAPSRVRNRSLRSIGGMYQFQKRSIRSILHCQTSTFSFFSQILINDHINLYCNLPLIR